MTPKKYDTLIHSFSYKIGLLKRHINSIDKIIENKYISKDSDAHPNQLFPSCLISLYSTCEIFLEKLCTLQQESNNHKIKIADLKSEGIEKYHVYITKVMNVDLSHLEFKYKELVIFGHIRNIMEDYNGYVGNYTELHKVFNFINHRKELEMSSCQQLSIVDTQILLDLCELIEYFVINVTEKCYHQEQVFIPHASFRGALTM